MVKRIVFFLLGGLLLLSLSGCAEVNEEFWINQDGSGKLHFDIGISESLLAMGNQESGDFDGEGLFKEQGVDSENPYLKNIITNQSSENGIRHYTVDADVIDFSKVFNALNEDESGIALKVEKLPNGNYQFTHTLLLDKMTAQNDETDSSEIDMSGLVASMLADRYWTVKLHSDRIVQTNGTWDKENKVVVWQIPLSQMFVGKGTVEMTAEYNTGLPILLIVGIGAGAMVFLVGIAVTVLLFLKHRSTTEISSVTPVEAE